MKKIAVLGYGTVGSGVVDLMEQNAKSIASKVGEEIEVKYIVDKVYMIHSVDSLRLAEEISKEAVKKEVNVNVLIEVNVAEEETKFGTTCEEAVQLVSELSSKGKIQVPRLRSQRFL